MKPKSEVQRRFEEIIEKKLNKKFISSGDLIRFRDACIKQGKQQAMKELLRVLKIFTEDDIYTGRIVRFEIINRLGIKQLEGEIK